MNVFHHNRHSVHSVSIKYALESALPVRTDLRQNHSNNNGGVVWGAAPPCENQLGSRWNLLCVSRNSHYLCDVSSKHYITELTANDKLRSTSSLALTHNMNSGLLGQGLLLVWQTHQPKLLQTSPSWHVFSIALLPKYSREKSKVLEKKAFWY